jgi:hypothetical protein
MNGCSFMSITSKDEIGDRLLRLSLIFTFTNVNGLLGCPVYPHSINSPESFPLSNSSVVNEKRVKSRYSNHVINLLPRECLRAILDGIESNAFECLQ